MIMRHKAATKLSDLPPHERANRLQTWIDALTNLLVDLVILMALVGLGYVAYISTQNQSHLDKGTQVLQILQCHLLPGHKCYIKDHQDQDSVIHNLERFEIAKSICVHNGVSTVSGVQRCVEVKLRGRHG